MDCVFVWGVEIGVGKGCLVDRQVGVLRGF